MMFKRLQAVTILALIGILMAVVVRGQLSVPVGAAGSPSAAETSVVDRGDIAQVVSATGPIQAQQNVALAFSTVGTVAAINVEEGDHVLKGQLLATLDKQSVMDGLLLAQARVNAQQVALRVLTDKPRQVDLNVLKTVLNLARARLTEANSGPSQQQVQIAALNVEIAQNQLWQAQLQRDITDDTKQDLQKNSRTYPSAINLPSDTVLNASIDAQDANVQVQQALLDATQAQGANVASVAAAQGQITAAQNALDKLLEGGDKDDVAQAQAMIQAAQAAVDQAKANLALTQLVAPFDGIVARVNLKRGAQTPAGPAIVMLDTSRFYVDLLVDEVDIGKVSEGQSAKLTFDALPGETLNGAVTRISSVASRAGVSVVYTVRVEFDPAGQPLRSAMSTTATIVTDQVTNAIRIRNRFVRLDRLAGKAYATVQQPDGRYEEVELTLGLRNDTYSEVRSGLAAGDTVALLPNPGLSASAQ
jgi:RND family efflux transporter MFP subunit